MIEKVRPVVLLILDGWGLSDSTDHNAIGAASKPVWDRLWATYPHTAIRTSGSAVGLPGGQMGNSEVGHLNLGAGRVVYQEFTRIGRSIRTGSFFSNDKSGMRWDSLFTGGQPPGGGGPFGLEAPWLGAPGAGRVSNW